jgi:hypothetical protein
MKDFLSVIGGVLAGVVIVVAAFAIGFALNAAGVALLLWLIDLLGKTALFTLRNVLIGAGIVTVIRMFFIPHNNNHND